MKQALIVVDVQRDFCEGGSLEVKGGNVVAEKIAVLMNDTKYDLIVISKDDHFKGSDNGGHISDMPDYVNTWPAHCAQGTAGSFLHPAVHLAAWSNSPRVKMVYKGQGQPAYSVFEGTVAYVGVSTNELLKQHDITHLTVVGIATDYCVKATVLEARIFGYEVSVPLDMTAAVADDTAKLAISDMRNAGVHIL